MACRLFRHARRINRQLPASSSGGRFSFSRWINQPLGVSPRFAKKPDANAFRLMPQFEKLNRPVEQQCEN